MLVDVVAAVDAIKRESESLQDALKFRKSHRGACGDKLGVKLFDLGHSCSQAECS